MTNPGLTRPLQAAQSISRKNNNNSSSATCPSPTPSFDARKLRNAKWSSSEEVNKIPGQNEGPANGAESPFVSRKNKDYKPVTFDSNSLKRSELKHQNGGSNSSIDPKESFAWKDSTLDRKLKELEERAKNASGSRTSETNGFDKNIDKSIGNWSNLPKAPNPDVILLQKAREEKKVKKYLEDNYQHRTDLISPDPELKNSENSEVKKFQGVGPKTKEGMPIGLRSMIYQENQGDWYKQMYNSIHRPKRHNDFNNRLTLEEQST